MKLHFFEPPPAQRVGGIDAAIHSLRVALRATGVEVDDRLPDDDGGAHVVHFHGLWQPAFLPIARECRRRRIPYVVSPHGMLEEWAWRHRWWKKWPYFHLVEKRFLSRAAALLATAEPEADRLRQMIPGQRSASLPLGLLGDAGPDCEAARAALGWRAEERVLLFLSRIHEKKGLDLLLRALATITLPPATRLVIVGGGEAACVDGLKALAADLAARLPRVDWLGEIWGVGRWKYFQAADLFCLPSHSENFGLAVLEACQVGTPALTTTATPWADYLADQHAYLCDPTLESIRSALTRFFQDDRADAAARATLSHWTHSEFAWPALIRRYVDFYAGLALSR